MAISAEAQSALDALAAIKDEAVDRMLAFNSQYESIASDLSQEDAEASLIDLDFEFHEWNDDYIVRLEKAQEEVQFEIDAGDITDINDVSDARAEIMDIVDNLTESANELSDNLASAQIEAARLSEEQNSAENTDSTDTDNTKAPDGADDEKGKDTDTNSTTIPGKAGKSKASTLPKVGLRDYNPLSEFSSYTYRLALYMMNAKQFNDYMRGNYSTIKDFQLIAQSGGITSGLDSPRAEGFELDIYLDDLEIVTLVNSKETMTASNSINFKFKVYEPYGFSFPYKLTKAMIASQKRNAALTNPNSTLDQIQSLNESFLMVIKFYGYDKEGKLVSSTDYPQPNVIKTDSQSVFERGFPIKIKDFKFKLENKLTVYSISAVQYAEQLAKGSNMGVVPAKMSISGETVQDVLSGKNQESGKTSIIGLAELLNKMEKEELDKKVPAYSKANEYVIKFGENTGIDNALLVPKDYYVKEKSPMGTINGGSANSNERTAWQKRLGTVEKKTRTIEVPAGQPIIQVIDNVISQSEYIKKMMVAVDKEINDTVKEADSETDVNSNPASMSWYNINTVAEKLEWDEKRRDYAHKITYIINKYEIPYIRSLYSSNTMQYYGPHKRYNYWYTGKNMEILSYEQDYNMLYTVTGPIASDAETKNLQSAKIKLKAGQNVDSTTTKSGKNDIINSIKSFLYSPGDFVNFKLKVLGDPDYLMPTIGTDYGGGENKWYGSDLSINPNSGQVFFEINFQQAEDYDNQTGLLIPNNDIQFADYPDTMKVKPKGIVYMLTQVTSTFSKGKFEQTLKGSIPEFVKGGSKSAETARATTPPATSTNSRENSSSKKALTQEELKAAQQAKGSGSNYKPTQTKSKPTLPESGVASDDNPGGNDWNPGQSDSDGGRE